MRAIWQTAMVAALVLGTAGGCGRVVEGAIAAAPGLLVTEQQAAEMGAQAAQQVIAQTPAFPDPTTQSYVQQIGHKVAAVSDRPDLTYTYTVVSDPTPNAFALPGGYIFITTSLLQLMTSEAQLAGVLGHETGHVAAGHSLQLLREQAIAQGVEVAVLGQNSSQMQALIANILASLLQNGYGRQKEYDADQLGAIYMSRAGYDPNQLIAFLTALDNATGSAPAWTALLQDHPTTQNRIARLQSLIASQHLSGTTINGQAFMSATAAVRSGVSR